MCTDARQEGGWGWCREAPAAPAAAATAAAAEAGGASAVAAGGVPAAAFLGESALVAGSQLDSMVAQVRVYMSFAAALTALKAQP
jgi:hypothetical protein